MSLWKCSFCEGSMQSDELRKDHEISCHKNPQNINMTSAHFKRRMALNKKRENKK